MTYINALLSAQDALVAVMVAVSASDEQVRTSELVAIQRMVNHMALFASYDPTAFAPCRKRFLICLRRKTGLMRFSV